MPASKKPIQHDTLTFVDEEMNYEDVTNLFKTYGTVKNVNKYINRFFIQFETLDQAKKAQSELGRIYRVAFAHARTRPRRKKNFRPVGELIRLSDPVDLQKCGYTAPKNTNTDTNTNTKTKTNIHEGLAMIQEYISNATRRHTSSASTRNEEARSNENPREHDRELENQKEKSKGSQNVQEMAKGSENCREMAKSSGNHTQSANENQHGGPANRKPNSSQVRDPENDDSNDSDDNMEEPEAQKAKAQKHPGEEGEYEREEEEHDDDQDENEEDQQPEARAVQASNRRRVRIEGLDEIMQELGSDMAYSVIVANIPEKYTLEEVYDLVEEVRPIAFSEMDYSIKMRVKFCEVFLNDAADVDYLKRKLNDFVICGKQLTVMEPAEILDETRWNA